MQILNINNEFIEKLSTILPLEMLSGSDLDKAFTIVGLLMDVMGLSIKEAHEKVFLGSFEDYIT